MVKTYRTIQQWDHWLTQPLGSAILTLEQQFLTSVLPNYSGQFALLIGVPRQHPLLHASVMLNNVVLSPLMNSAKHFSLIESEFYQLPIASGSVDLVILPHTVECVENQRHLIAEACRLVKPEGFIMLLGFNPFSLWGLKKWWVNHQPMPWSGNFVRPKQIKQWLSLADFELYKQDMLLFRPPFKNQSIFNKLSFMEKIGKFIYPGGIYVLTFRAKVIPLTPIKLHWRQKIPAMSSTLPRPTLRDMQ